MNTNPRATNPRPDTCEHCGRPRPNAPSRFTITALDQTDSTISHEKVFLYAECLRNARDLLYGGGLT